MHTSAELFSEFSSNRNDSEILGGTALIISPTTACGFQLTVSADNFPSIVSRIVFTRLTDTAIKGDS